MLPIIDYPPPLRHGPKEVSSPRIGLILAEKVRYMFFLSTARGRGARNRGRERCITFVQILVQIGFRSGAGTHVYLRRGNGGCNERCIDGAPPDVIGHEEFLGSCI